MLSTSLPRTLFPGPWEVRPRWDPVRVTADSQVLVENQEPLDGLLLLSSISETGRQ